MTRVYEHENGYIAILYGETSMTIQKPRGTTVIHTGARTVNTEEEVMKLLEDTPMFLERLYGGMND